MRTCLGSVCKSPAAKLRQPSGCSGLSGPLYSRLSPILLPCNCCPNLSHCSSSHIRSLVQHSAYSCSL